MLRKLTAYLLLVWVGVASWTVKADQHTDYNSRSKKMKEQAVIAVSIGDCSFKFNNYYKGWLLDFGEMKENFETYLGDNPVFGSYTFHISFKCQRIDELKAEFAEQEWPYSAYAPTQDETSGQWVVKPFALSKEDEKRLRDDEWSWVQIATLKKSQRGGALKAVNADGFYVLKNDIIGDENRRETAFLGCLMHPPFALCASTRVGAVSQPKQTLTPYVLKLLKTIEFLPRPDEAKSDPASKQRVDK